jgi:nitroreductase
MNAPGKTVADLIEARFGLPTEAGRALPAEGTVAQLLAHRTHRRYKLDPVPPDVLEIVLAAALSAPSKSDLQQVAVIVVRDRTKQATIGGWIPDMPWIATAPLFLVFCGDHRRMRRVSELRERPFPNDTLDMFMNAAVDAGLVLQSFITAAEALGLGGCPISVVRNHVEKLADLLALPPGVPRRGAYGRLSEPDGLDQHAAADRAHRPHRLLRRQQARRGARELRPPPRGAPRHAAGKPALRRSLGLHRAVWLVGGQGAAVLRSRAPQLRAVHPAPRLRAGLRAALPKPPKPPNACSLGSNAQAGVFARDK